MKLPYHWKQKWIRVLRHWVQFKRSANLFFYRVQDDIYEIDKVIHPYLHALNILLALLAVTSILIPLGFDLTPAIERLNQRLERWILLGFVVSFFLRVALTTNRKAYLKNQWFEGVMTLIAGVFLVDHGAFVIGLIEYFFVVSSKPGAIFLGLLKGYLLLLVFLKVIENLPTLLERQENTARFLVFIFFAVIAAGTLLLMLPNATQDGEGLRFIDALFTSTSAVCVTGLIVVDTATHFTMFGEIVIMVLIQLGGLGIITFATFLFLFISGGLGVGQMNAVKELIAEKNTSLVTSTLKKVVGLTLFVEAIGALAYYLSWDFEYATQGQRWLFSAFHAISAFCNAGFSLFTNSLADSFNATSMSINVITMILIVLGGLGFTVIWEMIRKSSKKSYRTRRLTLHTRIVLITTVLLIISGAVLILMLEWSNSLAGYSTFDKILLSLFQSITTRTAGFNTLDIGGLSVSVTLVMLILMVIGGSPASTAGGIKTTTFAVLVRGIVMTVKGYSRMEFFNRSVSNSIIFSAMSAILLATATIGVSTILLTITESHSFWIFYSKRFLLLQPWVYQEVLPVS